MVLFETNECVYFGLQLPWTFPYIRLFWEIKCCHKCKILTSIEMDTNFLIHEATFMRSISWIFTNTITTWGIVVVIAVLCYK